jgi:PAS domain S-box-containing protein
MAVSRDYQANPAARLHAIFDAAPVGIDDLTPGCQFVRVNQRFCELTGYSADELQTMRMHDVLHPDDLPADLAATERLLSGAAESYTMEKRFVRKDGTIVWAEVTRSVVRDPGGSPLLLVGVVRDITAQRAAEAQVAALTAELEDRVEQRTADLARANQNLEAFTFSVSHDLRAPLRALNGFAEALAEDYGDKLDETCQDYIRRIEAASERMSSLIDRLLYLSRISRAEIDLQPVDLSAEAAEIAADLAAGEPDRTVRVDIEPGVVARADRALIGTVVQNLVENAWKFTARRDDAAIEFGSTAGQNGMVCCFVRDNGAGFDPAYAGKLFRPFQRLHPVTDFPGTGIGLASVRQIVERHGGQVWAEGGVDSGATFYFTLRSC